MDLEAKKALLDARLIAFDANEAAINPPSDAQLESLGQLMAEVEALTTERKISEQVVRLTGEVLETFKEIDPGTA